MKILVLGDVCGEVGVKMLSKHLRKKQKKYNADLTGRPGITVSGMNRALLMAGQNMGELHLIDSIIQSENCTAGVAEYYLDAFLSQAGDDCLCTIHQQIKSLFSE